MIILECTVGCPRVKTNGKRIKPKRIQVRNLSRGMPVQVLEKRIDEMAELENAMSLYEHGVEAG